MRLSEAIRLGATMKPQAVHYFYNNGGTCALGAAVDACGRLSTGNGWVTHLALRELWPTIRQAGPICPVHGAGCLSASEGLRTLIPHLNNNHGWTREAIADWVELQGGIPTARTETPEELPDPIPTPEEMPLEVA